MPRRKNTAAVALGKRRQQGLSPAQRVQLAKKARAAGLAKQRKDKAICTALHELAEAVESVYSNKGWVTVQDTELMLLKLSAAKLAGWKPRTEKDKK